MVLAVVGLSAAAAPAHAITLPAGFSDQLVANVEAPTDIAFTPDGRILVTTEWGQLNLIENGVLQPVALDLANRICDNGERGLLGVAVDPAFGMNHYIYLFYTLKRGTGCPINDASTPASPSSPANRISRFILSDANTVDPASETVLIDNIVSSALAHNSGDLNFGPDGLLYATTGDGQCDYRGDSGCNARNDASRDQNVLNGKVLRIRTDGEIPFDNPFQGPDADRCNIAGQTAPGRKCKEIYAWGLRNPWRFAFDFDAPGNRFFINDVGQNTWEEIDLGQAGADYGWNLREGPCVNREATTNCPPPPPGLTDPIFTYNHSTGCSAVTGGAFVPNGWWPSVYDQSYLYADYVCGKIFKLDPNGSGGYTSTEFASTTDRSVVGMAFAPAAVDRALYYLDYDYDGGSVHRIAYTGTDNRTPSASATADPTSGDLPLAVDFDGSASSDPDDDPLTYDWDFGDGSAHGTGATTSHLYSTAGTLTATLTVSDGHGGTDTHSIRIDAGNNPPAPVITSPAAGKLFEVGEQVALTGSATDPEDGPLATSSLSWQVIKHHNTHAHPFLAPTTGNNLSITAPEPEDLAAIASSFLEVRLTATDSNGLSTTVTRNLNPKTVALTFQTVPSGLQLGVADATVTAPATVTSWDGWSFPVTAAAQDDAGGASWKFDHWLDGATTATRTIATPSSPTTYTAYFQAVYARPGSATPLRLPLVPAYAPCTAPNTTHVAPLSYPACSPPVQQSSLLTTSSVGKGRGYVIVGAVIDNPSTPADEADASIRARMTDVRRASDGLDYTGEVLLRWTSRITDSANGTSGIEPATTSDRQFSIPVPCTASPSPSLGSTCELASTLDSLVPGLLMGRRRTIMNSSTFGLLDAGNDGNLAAAGAACPPDCGTGDEGLFMRQGLFTP